MMFTSGTTGAPKGVMATHGQSVRAYAEWARLVGLRHGDRYLVISPFFHSYFEDTEQTAATVDAEGWLHTGDIGTLDERGYIRITDRKKDMYIVGGFNAYPAEIENVLTAHEDVAQVAVIGAPDPRLGEVGMAFVVPVTGHTVDPDGLVAWARERLANYKVPSRVRVVDALPLNPAGKVLKYELREQAQDETASGTPKGAQR